MRADEQGTMRALQGGRGLIDSSISDHRGWLGALILHRGREKQAADTTDAVAEPEDRTHLRTNPRLAVGAGLVDETVLEHGQKPAANLDLDPSCRQHDEPADANGPAIVFSAAPLTRAVLQIGDPIVLRVAIGMGIMRTCRKASEKHSGN
jgi:hypothetical protein